MNRYTIKQDDGYILHLYYPSIEAAKQAYPNASIEPYVDDSFIKHIEKIMALAEDASTTWWKIPFGCGYITYRQFKDEDGWLDGGEYMRYDKHSYTLPILKTLTNPQSFYERFFEGMNDGEHGFARFTKRQFGKLKGKAKPVKFCKIEGDTWYVDGYGNFFEHFSYLTGKEQVEEWKQFHDSPDAIYGKIWHGVHGKYTLGWHSNMDEFMADFKAKAEATPTWAATPRYEVKKIGYRKKHPYDRENYIRLPFYPITKIPKAERNVVEVVNSWKKLVKGIGYYGNGFYEDLYFENVIRKYWEWVDKNEL